jgi:hypothetical protein
LIRFGSAIIDQTAASSTAWLATSFCRRRRTIQPAAAMTRTDPLRASEAGSGIAAGANATPRKAVLVAAVANVVNEPDIVPSYPEVSVMLRKVFDAPAVVT